MYRLPARDLTQGTPHNYASLDGTVRTHIDLDARDCYIEADREHDPRALCDHITQAEWWGLELIDEDGYEPELLDDGGVRIHLAPIIPENQVAPLSLTSVMRTLPSQRTARLGAVAALVALAVAPFTDVLSGLAVVA